MKNNNNLYERKESSLFFYKKNHSNLLPLQERSLFPLPILSNQRRKTREHQTGNSFISSMPSPVNSNIRPSNICRLITKQERNRTGHLVDRPRSFHCRVCEGGERIRA